MKSQETLVGLPKYVAGKGNPDGFNSDLRKLGWFHLGISGNPGPLPKWLPMVVADLDA